MHVLTKNQIIRLVEALSKLTLRKINKAYIQNYDIGKFTFNKSKFIGFSNESFEDGLEAIYECQFVARNKKIGKRTIRISWNGTKFIAN
jgi:hypothetical protein